MSAWSEIFNNDKNTFIYVDNFNSITFILVLFQNIKNKDK